MHYAGLRRTAEAGPILAWRPYMNCHALLKLSRAYIAVCLLACNAKDGTLLWPPASSGTGGFGGSSAAGAATDGGGPSAGGSSGGTPPTERDAGPQPLPNGVADADAGPLDCGGTPFFSYVEASGVCNDNCRVCAIAVEVSRVATYWMIPDARCPCPDPRDYFLERDAGASGRPPTSCNPRGNYLTRAGAQLSCGVDAGSCNVCVQGSTAQAGPQAWSVTRTGCDCPEPIDECGGYPGLSEAEATGVCAGVPDCHVCVQETNAAGTPTLWMAHACGCPDAYARPD
jgi:hypothetical protein